MTRWEIPGKRRNKFNNKIVYDKDGNKYGSQKEEGRYGELLLMEKAGLIHDLEAQVPFQLLPEQYDDSGKKKENPVVYIADYVYYDKDGKFHVEDVKSPYTVKLPAYIIKRKLMLWVHGIRIEEIIR